MKPLHHSPPHRSQSALGGWAAVAALLLAMVTALLTMTSSAQGAVPANRNDPCATGNRNSCGTTGVGKYETYRYGTRWFGDFRGAVEDETTTFCIDLRFWYPGKQYRYAKISPAGLKNRDGRTVPPESLRQMSYALWKYGRSNNRNQQMAVMLYTHHLMGDERPGEVDPRVLGAAVAATYRRIERESERLHGPYTLRAELPAKGVVGVPVRGSVTLRSADGNPVPNTQVRVEVEGGRASAATVTTNARGVATMQVTPNATGRVVVNATSADLPATLPTIYAPTQRAAARNGQRLAAPASQQVSARAVSAAEKATIRVDTTARPAVQLVGEPNRDQIRLQGVPPGRKTTVTSLLFGPFRSQEQMSCDGEPYARNTVEVSESGTVQSPEVRPDRVGFYTYQVIIEGDDTINGVVTRCGIPAETFQVQTQPSVVTQVSNARIAPGDQLFDNLTVTGLNGESATVEVTLHGPYPTREALKCDGTPVWSGSVRADGDGDYVTEPFTVTTPGFYTYTERIVAQGFVRPQQSECAVVSETSIVIGTPAITTQISKQRSQVGDRVTDDAVITGLGALQAEVVAELWGPYPSEEAMTCTGTPFWKGTFTANGDGTYTTAPVRVDRAGYYTYRESILPGETTNGVVTECGKASQTTITTAKPAVTTVASSEVITPGARIFDTLRVTGLGRTPAEVKVDLYGPFPTRDAMRCTGTPHWSGTVRVTGDGTYRTEATTVNRVGFYVYRERLEGGDQVTTFQGECGLVSETALAKPTINTGRSDERATTTAQARLNQSRSGSRPTRVRVPALGINAPVDPAGINLSKGELAVPANISRLGWWRDGSAPGSANGATLIAGHVDSARRGAGAFFGLKRARAGQRIQVTTAAGGTRTYRITSVRLVLKDRLPDDIFSLKGRSRLVLVTCGGPFDRASGHYKDNIIVTAVPV